MKRYAADPMIENRRKSPPPTETDPVIEALVEDIIAKVADKWTMLILEVLEEHGTLRFTQIGRLVGTISQKMLTKTLRQMESDGLVRRTVHPSFHRMWIMASRLSETLGSAFAAFGYGRKPTMRK